ncbi:hypothetical protein BDY19DRAFT_959407 [Irpex rosettiformis]|uniref:Uncharacterized protein n=1 Tax=Irpex rosettiformis TaxID=378272 RepID=A0ACB8TX43_9APHY|nr:hypothetical protein BDY19DRAFT_959407 [Irpex rosettiformis]
MTKSLSPALPPSASSLALFYCSDVPALSEMNVETFVLDTPNLRGRVQGLKMTANRYTNSRCETQGGITVVACHGLSQHKEQWEPILQVLFSMDAYKPPQNHIREFWSFEWQSHGESYVLNKDLIGNDETAALINVWGAGIAEFIRSAHVDGHRLVGLAFSAGCVGLLLSVKYSIPNLPYIGIILLEPSLIDADTWYSKNQPMFKTMFAFMKKGADARRDSWSSKEEAAKYLKKTIPCSLWDDRIFNLYIEHALYKTTNKEGKVHIQRKCPADQSEGGWYNNMEYFWQAIEQSDRIQRIIPVYLVLGTANNKGGDVMLPAIRDMLLDKKKGRTYASVSYIPNVGHQLMQINPDEVATKVSQLLDEIVSNKIRANL